MFHAIMKFSNATEIRCTVDFSSVRIFRGVNADDAILCNCNYMYIRNGMKLSIRTEEKSAVFERKRNPHSTAWDFHFVGYRKYHRYCDEEGNISKSKGVSSPNRTRYALGKNYSIVFLRTKNVLGSDIQNLL